MSSRKDSSLQLAALMEKHQQEQATKNPIRVRRENSSKESKLFC
jgi:hypothetical protein